MAWLERIGVLRNPPDMRPAHAIEEDIRDEFAAHMALRAQDNEAAGMTRADAQRDAAGRFGDVDAIARTCRSIQMKERIMLQRINTIAVLALLAITAVSLWNGRSTQRDTAREVAGVRQDVVALGRLLGDTTAPDNTPGRVAALRDVDVEIRRVESELTMLRVEERKTVRHPKVAARIRLLETLRADRERLATQTAGPSDATSVYLLGPVASPGRKAWFEHMTLAKALALGGGFEATARRTNVAVVRSADGGDERIEVNMVDVMNGKSPDVPLAPGDVVIVPESLF